MASVKSTCPCCNKDYMRTQKQLNQVIKRSGVWRCRPCTQALRIYSNAKPIGSVRVHKPTGYIDQKTQDGWRRQHVVVMENAIGRRINKGEVVHHINEIKSDNRIENLALMTTGEHTAVHHTGAKRTEVQCSRIAHGCRTAKTARLTYESVKFIRSESAKPGVTGVSISMILGVSPMTVNRVINNESWR